jgi:hypothetical protein
MRGERAGGEEKKYKEYKYRKIQAKSSVFLHKFI